MSGDLYKNSEAYIKVSGEGPKFKTERRLMQEDPFSPTLFNCVLTEIFRSIESEGKGLKIFVDGEWINNLKFADDMISD